jgi:uncharacterized integral membrane protein
MRRLFAILIAALGVLLGVSLGAVNTQSATLDLFVAQPSLPLGVMVLACVLLGAVLAGVVLYAAVILPLRIRLARANRGREDAGTDEVRR